MYHSTNVTKWRSRTLLVPNRPWQEHNNAVVGAGPWAARDQLRRHRATGPVPIMASMILLGPRPRHRRETRDVPARVPWLRCAPVCSATVSVHWERADVCRWLMTALFSRASCSTFGSQVPSRLTPYGRKSIYKEAIITIVACCVPDRRSRGTVIALPAAPQALLVAHALATTRGLHVASASYRLPFADEQGYPGGCCASFLVNIVRRWREEHIG